MHHIFVFAFFLCDFSRANNIKKQLNTATSVIKPVIKFFPFRKIDRFDCEISYKETKYWILNFWLNTVNNCTFFLNCCRQHELRLTVLICAYYLQLFTTFLFSWKWKKRPVTSSLVLFSPQLDSSYVLQYYNNNTLFYMFDCVYNFIKPIFKSFFL